MFVLYCTHVLFLFVPAKHMFIVFGILIYFYFTGLHKFGVIIGMLLKYYICCFVSKLYSSNSWLIAIEIKRETTQNEILICSGVLKHLFLVFQNRSYRSHKNHRWSTIYLYVHDI